MIYLDHNATTPVLPEVLEAMMPFFTTEWGNPSSSYKFGSKLKKVIETAREQVADLVGAHPLEIIFTSCGTESNNAAIHAALKANPGTSLKSLAFAVNSVNFRSIACAASQRSWAR